MDTESSHTPKCVRIKLDMNLFEASTLRDEVSLEVAVSILESHLANPRVDKEDIVIQLMEQAGLLGLMLSGTLFALEYRIDRLAGSFIFSNILGSLSKSGRMFAWVLSCGCTQFHRQSCISITALVQSLLQWTAARVT